MFRRKTPDHDRDREGRTQLHYAALDDQFEQARSLLNAGANPSAKDKLGWTPLHAAAQAYALKTAALLIEHRAEVNAQDANGNTPLSEAVFESCGRGEMIALLRRAGGDPNLQNRSGVSPLSLARSIANYDVKQFFADLP